LDYIYEWLYRTLQRTCCNAYNIRRRACSNKRRIFSRRLVQCF